MGARVAPSHVRSCSRKSIRNKSITSCGVAWRSLQLLPANEIRHRTLFVKRFLGQSFSKCDSGPREKRAKHVFMLRPHRYNRSSRSCEAVADLCESCRRCRMAKTSDDAVTDNATSGKLRQLRCNEVQQRRCDHGCDVGLTNALNSRDTMKVLHALCLLPACRKLR